MSDYALDKIEGQILRCSIKETDLYSPVKAYLTGQGYEVKGEVNHCDIVAIRGQEPPLIVELKTTLNIELILQAADRLKLSPSVYIAFPKAAAQWKRHWKRVRGLCRRLGVGIITLDGKALNVNVRLDPMPYQSRGNSITRHRLLREFEKRVGDPNQGGVTRTTVMTAYRQDALRCVGALKQGPLKLTTLRKQTQVAKAQSIMLKDHYGWFERVSRGWYQLSPNGLKVADQNVKIIKTLLQAQALNKEEGT